MRMHNTQAPKISMLENQPSIVVSEMYCRSVCAYNILGCSHFDRSGATFFCNREYFFLKCFEHISIFAM